VELLAGRSALPDHGLQEDLSHLTWGEISLMPENLTKYSLF
jgi:hypothetical protein